MHKTQFLRRTLTVGLLTTTMIACQPATEQAPSETDTASQVPAFWPKLQPAVKDATDLESRIQQILSGMTIEHKVAQIIQPEIRDITLEDMRQYGFGSYLNGGGAFPDNNKHASVQDWVDLAEAMYQASVDSSLDGSTIPTMWGTDAVHGHNNVIGATLFPHNIGLGAMRNPALIEQIAQATAKEVLATGIDWIFAPTVAVARDDRWGRTYESYSEDPDIVYDYSAAIVKGMQGDLTQGGIDEQHVISTVKHFLGDGGTEGGDDQGDNLSSEEELFRIHAQGYVGGLNAGSQSVMASFNSWHGDKIHGNHYLLTEVLKERMGFDGFVVGDWNGHGQIPGCSNGNCPQAINAGLDVFMVPTKAWKPLYENTVAQVKDGTIPMARLDDAVTRLLRVKLRAGLFDKPSPAKRKMAGDDSVVGNPEHRALARQAVRESLVLLKNNKQILPLTPMQNILVAGDGAHNIGKQSGGWSVTWQGTGNTNDDFPGGSSIFDGIRETVEAAGGVAKLSVDGAFTDMPDVAIVVFGENPYAEGNGDLSNLDYQRGNKTDLALLQHFKEKGVPVVSVFLSGRPMWVNGELNASDAFVAAWLPGSEGAGVADVLFGDAQGKVRQNFTGKLSFSWPIHPEHAVINRNQEGPLPLFAYGYGLSYGDTAEVANDLPETYVPSDAAVSDVMALYDRSVQAPWKVVLEGGEETVDMNSSQLVHDNLAVRTLDRRVQEDAVQLQWQAEQGAAFTLVTPFSEDLRDYEGGTLVFDYRLPQPVQGPQLSVQMRCLESCAAEVQVGEQLKHDGENWQTLAIDLACFTQGGMDFTQVAIPLSLRSATPLTLHVSDIRITRKLPDASQHLSCGN